MRKLHQFSVQINIQGFVRPPSRLMLLCHIVQKERSVGEIQADLGFKQPALSQQLAELRQAGVVRARRESRQIHYSIADDRVAAVMEMVMRVFCGNVETGAMREAAVPASPFRSVTSNAFGEMAHWARLEKAD